MVFSPTMRHTIELARHMILILSIFTILTQNVIGQTVLQERYGLQEQYDAVRKVDDYINSITTLQGHFTQLSPDGQISRGRFFMQRPGKLRFEYAPPNPILVIADGYWVGIENREEQRTEKYPLSNTLFSLLLEERVALMNQARITRIEETEARLSITLEDRGEEMPGRITLSFSNPDMTLRKWTVLDAQGLTTHVNFFDLTRDVQLDPRLFQINDHLELNHGTGR